LTNLGLKGKRVALNDLYRVQIEQRTEIRVKIYYHGARLAPERESHYKDSILEGDLISREAGFLQNSNDALFISIELGFLSSSGPSRLCPAA